MANLDEMKEKLSKAFDLAIEKANTNLGPYSSNYTIQSAGAECLRAAAEAAKAIVSIEEIQARTLRK